MLLREHSYELELRDVGVLELVDEHVTEALLVARQRFGVLPEQPYGKDQQVVEVDCGCVGQASLVFGVYLGDTPLGGTRRHLRVLRGQHELVLQRADLRVQLSGREPLRVEVQVTPDPVGETLRVRLVVDREARSIAEQ